MAILIIVACLTLLTYGLMPTVAFVLFVSLSIPPLRAWMRRLGRIKHGQRVTWRTDLPQFIAYGAACVGLAIYMGSIDAFSLFCLIGSMIFYSDITATEKEQAEFETFMVAMFQPITRPVHRTIKRAKQNLLGLRLWLQSTRDDLERSSWP